jgi:hypothetical protein
VLGVMALLTAAACVAAPVQAGKVHAGPFTAAVTPKYDSVGGRFRLHVGPYRDSARRLTQTLTWNVPHRFRVGSQLTIMLTRLSPAPVSIIAQYAPRAPGAGAGKPWTFPSIVQPTSAGCWRMTLRSGATSGSLKVLVRG